MYIRKLVTVIRKLLAIIRAILLAKVFTCILIKKQKLDTQEIGIEYISNYIKSEYLAFRIVNNQSREIEQNMHYYTKANNNNIYRYFLNRLKSQDKLCSNI